MIRYAVMIAVAIGYSWLMYNKGYSVAQDEYALKAKEQLEQTMLANQAMYEHVAELDERHTTELLDAQENIDSVLNTVRTNERKLYIRTKTKCPVSDNTKASSVDDATTTAELDSRTAERIINLTARGDRAIIQLTACQEFIKGLVE